MRTLVVTSGLVLATTILVCVWVFSAYRIWLPMMSILLGLFALALVLILWRYHRANHEGQLAREQLRSFVSDSVQQQLESDRNFVVGPATCVVTDIRNFTAMGEALSPAELHSSNHAYFSRLFDCVSDSGVDVVKTYGDSMTAVWLGTGEDTLQRVISACFDILSTPVMTALPPDCPPIETHIGLQCGEIAIGYVGDKSRKAVEVTGNTVYLASRLEQLNKTQGTRLLTSGGTARLLQMAQTRSLGEMSLKGFSEPVHVVEIISPCDLARKKMS